MRAAALPFLILVVACGETAADPANPGSGGSPSSGGSANSVGGVSATGGRASGGVAAITGGTSASAGGAHTSLGGSSQSSGGATSNAGGSPNANAPSCDLRKVMCRVATPDCAQGEVPSTVGTCYGPCVRIDTCACASADECPDPNMYTCLVGQGHCSYYLR